jgi:hypothetical protein
MVTDNAMAKRTNNDMQNTTQKTKVGETWTPLKSGRTECSKIIIIIILYSQSKYSL